MATSSESESTFWQSNPKENEGIGKQTDRISSLPDAIIHHIFSFISTIDIVRTSMLAKRWRYLWTENPYLHFNDDQVPLRDSEDAFVNFVNGVITQYKAPVLERFSLSVRQQHNAVCVDDWVRFAAQIKVGELDVEVNADMTAYEPIELPCCATARTLRLQLGGRGLILPVTGIFSSLETLSFSRLGLINDATVHTVSKQCPRLRMLTFTNCTGLHHLNIQSPHLESLEIRRCGGLDQLSVYADKLISLSIHDSFTYASPSVNILAPKLQVLSWLDYIVGKFDIGNFTCLRSARISLVVSPFPEDKHPYLESARNFFRSLASAQSLAVEIACFWGLSTNRDLLEGLSAAQYNLEHMKLLVGFDKLVFKGISYLFKTCPNLQNLEVQIINKEHHKQLKADFPLGASLFEGEDNLTYQTSSLNHLQEAILTGFRGKEHEIEFVEFLLENSVNLRTMSILFSREVSLDTVQRASICQKLMELKRASLNATIRVS